MVELVEKPDVHAVAHTVIDPNGLAAWAEAHGMRELLWNDTPLGWLYQDVSHVPAQSIDALPEFGGRFCYRSWERGRERPEYVQNILEMGHGSVLHHSTVSFAISGVSRSLSLELLRHHAGADPSQESQRYVDAKDVRFVVPPLMLALRAQCPQLLQDFEVGCSTALDDYQLAQRTLEKALGSYIGTDIKLGTMTKKRCLEAARAYLPNSAETRLLFTTNLRALRYICMLRGGETADLEIRRLAVCFTRVAKQIAPLTFQDFEIYTAPDGFEATRCQHEKV